MKTRAHIAKPLADLFARSQTPLLRRGWGRLLLLTTILLLAGSRYAHAQNTGSEPYLDSEHSYRVRIGDVNNHREWIIYNVTDDALTTLYSDINTDTTPSWAVIYPEGSDAGEAGIGFHGVKIFFDNAFFTTDNWQLQYYEYLEHDNGTYECVSARSFDITLSENTFWLLVGTDETDQASGTGYEGIQVYNSQHTLVHTITDLEDPDDLFNTTVNYTVTMNKGVDFEPTYWQFNANFAEEVQSFSATVSTTNGGTAATTIGTQGEEYTVKVIPESTFNLSEVKVTITVQYRHNVLDNVVRNLVVTEGVAVVEKSEAPDAITDDNITTYPPGSVGNRTQAITILAIPSTQDITYDNSVNINETATSAQNPLQNSTHYYKVTMGSIANTGKWELKDSDGATVSIGITIADSKNATDALATINYGELTTGSYTLYFTETDATTGASTVREYPITVLPPFEVVASNVADGCPTASGKVYADKSETNTVISYTVSLPDTDPDPSNEEYYPAAWSYTMSVGSNPAFNDDDLIISGFSNTTTGASLSGTDDSRSVSVNAGVTSVTIDVTYYGYYNSAHDIIVTIEAKGSYSETAGDVTIEHTINALPQPGELAGVD